MMTTLFQRILDGQINLHLNFPSLRYFFARGQLLVPMVGIQSYDQADRLDYIKRFDSFVDSNYGNIDLLDYSLSSMIAFLSPTGIVVYGYFPETENEKFYFIPEGTLSEHLLNYLRKDAANFVRLNRDLWDSYLDSLTL